MHQKEKEPNGKQSTTFVKHFLVYHSGLSWKSLERLPTSSPWFSLPSLRWRGWSREARPDSKTQALPHGKHPAMPERPDSLIKPTIWKKGSRREEDKHWSCPWRSSYPPVVECDPLRASPPDMGATKPHVAIEHLKLGQVQSEMSYKCIIQTWFWRHNIREKNVNYLINILYISFLNDNVLDLLGKINY